MSCFAKIKSPLNGKSVTSTAYYQLTSFFPPAKGKEVYEALTTNTFKTEFGFDWTKRQQGYSPKLNFLGEPTIDQINSILKLNLSPKEIRAAEQIEEVASLGYLNKGYSNPNAFDNIVNEISLNPKYSLIQSEVLVRDGKYYLSVKPAISGKTFRPISKEYLRQVKFPGMIVNNVENFSNATLTELLDNLIKNKELQPFQHKMVSRLRDLMKVNPTLELAVFDEADNDGDYQRSFYDPKSNTIYIAKSIASNFDTQRFAQELIHEAVHAYTISALTNPTTVEEVKFRQEMEQYMTEYTKNYPKLQHGYGFKNVEEFVSEYLSNPYFREELQDAEATAKDKGFISRVVGAIKRFLKQRLNLGETLFNKVDQTIEEYFDYLETLEDMPDLPGEHELRFSQPYNSNQSSRNTPEISKFKQYVDSTINSSSWKQLTQSLSEIDPRFASIEKIKEKFGNISSNSLSDAINSSIDYLGSLEDLLNRIQKDVILYENNLDQYSTQDLVSAFNHAMNIGSFMVDQMVAYENLLLPELIDTSTKTDVERTPYSREEFREERRKQVENFDAVSTELKQRVIDLKDNANKLISAGQRAILSPVASELESVFLEISNKLKDPDSELNQQIAEKEEQLAQAQARNQPKRAADLTKDLKELYTFRSWIPTKKNIETLLRDGMKEEYKGANSFTIYLGIANMSGSPLVQVVKQYLDVHLTEAGNKSKEYTQRATELNEKIIQRNKNQGIRWTLSLDNFNKNLTRVVDMVYYDNSTGVRRVVKQLAYNTQFKEAEFRNDLQELTRNLEKANENGVEAEILDAEQKLQKFLDTYAVRPYKDEYYEAEELLIDEAREARQTILEELEDIQAIFSDDEATEEERQYRVDLKRKYERLGSIFNEDGTEKPKGSKERNIADSIIAYKNKRKSLDAIEFVIPDKIRIRFDIEKESRKKAVNDLDVKKQRLVTEIADGQSVGTDVSAKETELEQVNQQLELAQTELRKWLDTNARTEIDPEFFELQRSIADKIKAIFLKYGEDPLLSEAYDELFNAVKGYRDQDGIIRGNDIQEGLGQTIKAIEQKIEDLKSEAEESRELTEEDKALLKKHFADLSAIQVKKKTEYYNQVVKEISDVVRTEIYSDPEQVKAMDELAEKLTDEYIESGGYTEDPLLEIDEDLPLLDHPSDFGNAQHRINILDAFRTRIETVRIQNGVKQTDWYKANHITITKSYVDKKTGGKITKVYERPIYIWNRTVPTNINYIKQENPNFDWSVPRVREELKNKDYNFLGFKGTARPRKTDDNRYTNEAYGKLQSEDQDIIDDMVELYEDIQRNLPVSQRLEGYVVPNKTKGTREEVIDLFGRTKYSFNSIVDGFKIFFNRSVTGEELEEDETSNLLDVNKNAILKNSGRKLQLIKTRFKEPLNVNQVSHLLTTSLAQYGVYASDFAGLKKAMPAIFAARDAASKANIPVEDLEWIDLEISRFFYGGETQYQLAGKNELLKVIATLNNKLFRFTQKRVLLANFLRLPKNLFNNFLKIVLSKNRYGLTRRELWAAWWKGLRKRSALLSLEQGSRKYDVYALKLMHFRAMPTADPTKMANNIEQGFLYKFLNLDNYSTQIFGYMEMASTLPIYEALMARMTVPMVINGQQTTIKLDDAYEVIGGILVPKDGVFGLEQNKMRALLEERKNLIDTYLVKAAVRKAKDLTTQQQRELNALIASVNVKIASLEKLNAVKREKLRSVEQVLRDQIHEMYTSTQGNYYPRSRSGYERILWANIVMSMRRWTYPLLQTSYGTKRMSLYTGKVEEGFYRTGGKSLVRKMRYLASGERKSIGTTQFDKEKHERIFRDNINLMGLHALAWATTKLALAAGGDDDDWLIHLLAMISFTTYEEYAGTHPVAAPANYTYKVVFRKPLSKGPEEGIVESAAKGVAYTILGSQVASYDALFDALFDYKALTDPMSPYYEQRRGGYGGKSEYTPKATEGLPRILALGMKVYGVEQGLKPFVDSRRALETRLKLTPMLGIQDPLGDYLQVQKKLTNLSRQMLERGPEDLDYVIKGEYSKIKTPSKEELITQLSEWIDLQNEKETMEMYNPTIRMMKREQELSAAEGTQDKALIESLAKRTGKPVYEAAKDPWTVYYKEVFKVYNEARRQKIDSVLLSPDDQYQNP
jgi:hypothetical protein